MIELYRPFTRVNIGAGFCGGYLGCKDSPEHCKLVLTTFYTKNSSGLLEVFKKISEIIDF